MMFLKYNFHDDGKVWVGTIRASQILAIDYESNEEERETEEETVLDEWYSISFVLNEIHDRCVFETQSIQKMEAVNSAICEALSTGEPQYIEETGFCEPFWLKDEPPIIAEQTKNVQNTNENNRDRPKFLSDPD